MDFIYNTGGKRTKGSAFMTVSTIHRVILPKRYTKSCFFCDIIKPLRKYYHIITTIIIIIKYLLSSICYVILIQITIYYTQPIQNQHIILFRIKYILHYIYYIYYEYYYYIL